MADTTDAPAFDEPSILRFFWGLTVEFYKHYLIIWPLAISFALPGLVILLVAGPPSTVGYFVLTTVGLALVFTGAVALPQDDSESSEEFEPPFTSETTTGELIVGAGIIYAVFSTATSTVCVLAAVGAYLIGAVAGYPLVAVAVAVWFPDIDSLLYDHLGVAPSSLATMAIVAIIAGVSRFYGYDVEPLVEAITDAQRGLY